MDILDFRDFCLSLPLTEETTPFDEDTLVYKIGGKMYVYASISNFSWMAVKCDPEEGMELIEQYGDISRAPHTKTFHWISINPQGTLPDRFIKDRIRDSYRLVIKGMTRLKKREVFDSIRNSGEELWFSLEELEKRQ